MPLSPDEVEKRIINRVNVDEICQQIDNVLVASDYVGAVVEVAEMPTLAANKVADAFRNVGWSVSVKHKNASVPSVAQGVTVFKLDKYDTSSYMDR